MSGVPQRPVRVFLDARFAVRGLGIASATCRLTEAIGASEQVALRSNFSSGGWNRRGQLETLRMSGFLELTPAADPRTWGRDVVHYYGNTAPQLMGRRTLVTVHDLMSLRGTTAKSRLYQALLMPGLRRGRRGRVVAVSSQTADELLQVLPELRPRLQVITHGRREGLFSAQPREHILLFGGQSDSRKRVSLALSAYSTYAARQGASALPLVIAGRAGITPSLVAAHVTSGRVRIDENPGEDALSAVMARAACLLYPSSEEGFGLPIVEAGEMGTPVVFDSSARIPSEPIGGHGFPVDGTNRQDWARAIAAAAMQGPVPNALDHLPTWDQVAGAYVEVYRLLAAAS